MKRLALALALIALAACSKTPDEPTFDNPFDPNGSAPGTGYGLEVITSGQTVVMTWDNLPGVFSYDVYWSDASDDPSSMTLIEEQLEAPSIAPKIQYTHGVFTAETTNWYRIVGWEAVETGDPDTPFQAGRAMEPSVAIALDVSALLAPSDGLTTTATRFIDLDVLTGLADSVEISNRRSFDGSVTVVVTPGEVARIPWELATEVRDAGTLRDVENNDDLWVHFRTIEGGVTGPQDSTSVKVLFSPKLTVERGLRPAAGGNVMVDTDQRCLIGAVPGQSLGSVRLELTRDAGRTWEQVREIPVSALTDTVKVFFDPGVEEALDHRLVSTMFSDFGFSATATLRMNYPLSMGDPAIEIVGGSHTTADTLQIVPTCDNAGLYIVSEDPGFAGGVWQPWEAEITYPLVDTTPGLKFVYAAFQNPILGETRVTSTFVTLVEPPARLRH
jgi:hypothetical protein